jgi:hypothetical protein
MEPELGVRWAMRSLSRVDLPEPLGPRMARIFPDWREREMLRRVGLSAE